MRSGTGASSASIPLRSAGPTRAFSPSAEEVDRARRAASRLRRRGGQREARRSRSRARWSTSPWPARPATSWAPDRLASLSCSPRSRRRFRAPGWHLACSASSTTQTTHCACLVDSPIGSPPYRLAAVKAALQGARLAFGLFRKLHNPNNALCLSGRLAYRLASLSARRGQGGASGRQVGIWLVPQAPQPKQRTVLVWSTRLSARLPIGSPRSRQRFRAPGWHLACSASSTTQTTHCACLVDSPIGSRPYRLAAVKAALQGARLAFGLFRKLHNPNNALCLSGRLAYRLASLSARRGQGSASGRQVGIWLVPQAPQPKQRTVLVSVDSPIGSRPYRLAAVKAALQGARLAFGLFRKLHNPNNALCLSGRLAYRLASLSAPPRSRRRHRLGALMDQPCRRCGLRP